MTSAPGMNLGAVGDVERVRQQVDVAAEPVPVAPDGEGDVADLGGEGARADVVRAQAARPAAHEPRIVGLQREAERLGHAAVAQVDGLGLDRGEVLRAEGQVEEHLRKRGYRARPGIGRIVHAGSPISFSCR